MAILSIEAQEMKYVRSSRGENANILAPGPQITKLVQLTLKVKEKKVSLFFLFQAQEPRYGHFII